ncbi:hypothetical protein K7X08_023606 [Anisodus acutangulus]|uniref:Uncharacterized protein n=1 Tax=Anisodus acutangulus TaxID=402998 RepID=A0A9Q1QVN8_9SOLA|nr:hypothetical protein K7X08_023606 [Anisodus acutangulus]
MLEQMSQHSDQHFMKNSFALLYGLKQYSWKYYYEVKVSRQGKYELMKTWEEQVKVIAMLEEQVQEVRRFCSMIFSNKHTSCPPFPQSSPQIDEFFKEDSLL